MGHGICNCDGCDRLATSRINGVWYCNKHYLRLYTNGTLEKKCRKRTTKLIDDGGDCVSIETQKGARILISRADIDKVMRYSWCVSKTGYPVANINGKVTKLHRYLLGMKPGEGIADHINGNPLDNRKENLRICSAVENGRNHGLNKNNTTGFTGITRNPNGKYRARIVVDKKEVFLGNYDLLSDAIAARRDAEIRYYGAFAPHLWRHNHA